MEVECCEILVVDDHPIVLEGIKKIASALEGVKCDGIMEVEQLEHYFSARSPYNMYILDLEFPQADGFSVLRMLRDKAPDSRILIYTMHEEPWMLAKLIDADIDGLVRMQICRSYKKRFLLCGVEKLISTRCFSI